MSFSLPNHPTATTDACNPHHGFLCKLCQAWNKRHGIESVCLIGGQQTDVARNTGLASLDLLEAVEASVSKERGVRNSESGQSLRVWDSYEQQRYQVWKQTNGMMQSAGAGDTHEHADIVTLSSWLYMQA